MASEASFEVVLIPHEYAESSKLRSYARKFRELRLQALHNDPASFSSSHASEIQRLTSFWTERLLNPQAHTFALVQVDSASSGLLTSAVSPGTPWDGVLVLLGPKVVDFEEYDNESTWKTIITEAAVQHQVPPRVDRSSSSRNRLAYHIVAVYVTPKVRGKGLARKMIANALALLERQSKGRGYHKAICTIGVSPGLCAARKTYERMGFEAVAEDHFITEDGRDFHETVMRRNFTFPQVEIVPVFSLFNTPFSSRDVEVFPKED